MLLVEAGVLFAQNLQVISAAMLFFFSSTVLS